MDIVWMFSGDASVPTPLSFGYRLDVFIHTITGKVSLHLIKRGCGGRMPPLHGLVILPLFRLHHLHLLLQHLSAVFQTDSACDLPRRIYAGLNLLHRALDRIADRSQRSREESLHSVIDSADRINDRTRNFVIDILERSFNALPQVREKTHLF